MDPGVPQQGCTENNGSHMDTSDLQVVCASGFLEGGWGPAAEAVMLGSAGGGLLAPKQSPQDTSRAVTVPDP